MRHIHRKPNYIFAAGCLAFLAIALFYGCASEKRPLSTTRPALSEQSTAQPTKGRAQVWSENCMRCHNMRPPDWYSDAEWEVAMQHMRGPRIPHGLGAQGY